MGLKTYHYKGLTPDNTLITGTHKANSLRDLGRFLHSRHIRLVRYTQWGAWWRTWMRPIRPLDIHGFCIYMAHILASGKPVYESLRAFQAERSDALTQLIQEIAAQLSQGVSLSEALKSYPHVFPASIIALIYRGEQSGDLSLAFQHAHAYLHHTTQIQQKWRSALRYPLFLFLLFISMLGSFVSLLLPQLTPFLHQLPGTLPLSSRSLFQTLSLLQNHGSAWIGGICVVIGAIWMVYHSRYKSHLHKLMLHLPLIGPLVLTHTLAQIAQTYRLLLGTQSDVLHSLTTCLTMQNNIYIREQLTTVLPNLSRGASLTTAFRATALFPPFFLQVLETGEKSDSLASCFLILENYYTHLLHMKLNRLTEMLYPCALSFIGLLMIWIVVGIFSPLYNSLALLE